jgi:hypothetical protein
VASRTFTGICVYNLFAKEVTMSARGKKKKLQLREVMLTLVQDASEVGHFVYLSSRQILPIDSNRVYLLAETLESCWAPN